MSVLGATLNFGAVEGLRTLAYWESLLLLAIGSVLKARDSSYGFLSPKLRRLGYHNCMKPTPKTPTFARFTEAVRQIVSVPKTEILKREREAKAERQTKRASASARASRATER